MQERPQEAKSAGVLGATLISYFFCRQALFCFEADPQAEWLSHFQALLRTANAFTISDPNWYRASFPKDMGSADRTPATAVTAGSGTPSAPLGPARDTAKMRVVGGLRIGLDRHKFPGTGPQRAEAGGWECQKHIDVCC